MMGQVIKFIMRSGKKIALILKNAMEFLSLCGFVGSESIAELQSRLEYTRHKTAKLILGSMSSSTALDVYTLRFQSFSSGSIFPA